MNGRLDREVDIQLSPGELYITDLPLLIKTLLGTCLSVIFHTKPGNLAAMSHAQLPGIAGCHECCEHCPLKCRTHVAHTNLFQYVNSSTEYMLEQFISHRVKKEVIQVKIVGRPNVLGAVHARERVCCQNIQAAAASFGSIS